MNKKVNIGERIRKFRRYSLMSIEELAKKIGKTRVTVISWEKNKSKPSYDYLQKIADVLKIDIEDLLSDNKKVVTNQIIGNNNYNINQTNNKNIENILSRITILEKEVEILKLKVK
jgi:transcriptional regulator with XRE-family HTH domain